MNPIERACVVPELATNMAKAALNMLTRTAGPELAGRGVLMTSVDTGWITYEQPFLIAEQMRQSGSAPPLDTIDGAARILDPVFQGVSAGVAMHSVFLKDYHPTDW